MARDKITVDLLLATKQAEREIAKINRRIKDLGKTAGKSFGGMGGGTDKVRALGSGLSKATVKADEFSKSLEASNARVIAFGASAGLIMAVDRAMKAMVTSAIKVEKAMMDVSVVMQVSSRQLDQFGKGMFRVAKETAQGFDIVAEAATELARQGLGMEKTLERAKDALILTRLTGMSAADAVKSLTAAVNSFNKEGVTSADVINRMAKVDAAFAVSSDDLAKSISRVGASAISAGVGMNELMAITTAVQQKTARGGAVIGNAFKTIFTRIQRSDVQKKLRDMGISATDNFGRMKSGMVVLQNMADGFDSLTKSQQASLAENVAGVFQVNILKAALSDLSSATSHYKGALDAANSATNEAYQRNEQLNQTLDSLTNRTLVNLTKAGASLGGATLAPAIRKILNSVNGVIDAFSEGGRFEKFGSTIGEGLLSGIGNFIKGPGLIIVGTAFMKLGLSLAKFAGSAFKDLMGLNVATKQRIALEEAVIAHIASEPALLAKVRTGTLNVLAVEKDILATVRLANAERLKIQAYARPLAGALVGRGMRAGSKGATMPGGAAGFVPNFASPGGERAAAAAGGYRAGSIKTIRQPGAGTMMYNGAETVKRFAGMSQSAIMPPQESPAGAGYKAAFGGAHGFDPYAGRGFVPNFVRPPKLGVGKSGYGGVGGFTGEQRDKWRNSPAVRGKRYLIPASDIGVLLALSKQKHSTENLGSRGTDVSKLLGLQRYQPLGKQLISEKAKVQLTNVRFRGYMNADKEEAAEASFSSQLNQTLQGSVYKLAEKIQGKLRIKGRPLSMGPLSESVEGGIFEEAMRMAMGASVAAQGAAFDFDSNSQPSEAMQKIFGEPPIIRRIDAKRARHLALGAEMPKKYFNDNLMSGRGVREIMRQREALYSQVFKTDARHASGTAKAGQQKGPLRHMVTSFTRPKPGRPMGPGGAEGFVPNFFMGRLLGRRQAVTHGSALLSPVAKRLQMLPGVGKIKSSVWGDMWKSDNVKKVRDILSGRVVTAKILGDPRAQALIGSHKGKAMGEATKSLYEGTLLGIPLSVWVAQQAARRGVGVLTGSVKMIRNVAKKQPIAKGINMDEMFKAGGFVPNFSPLTSAIGREMQAGVPASAIRVGSSPSLRSVGNPGGVGVYNTIQEPGGLNQGIATSMAQGINPKSHGVPNYATVGRSWPSGSPPPPSDTVFPRDLKAASESIERGGDSIERSSSKDSKTAKINEANAAKMQRVGNVMMMASIAVSMAGPALGSAVFGGKPSGEAIGGGLSNLLSMGMMGAATGAMMGGGATPLSPFTAAIGGAIGLALGAVSMDWGMAFGEKGQKADAEQVKQRADLISEGLEKVTKALNDLANVDFMTTEGKVKAYANVQEKLAIVQDDLVAGGEETEGALSAFKTARNQLGNLQDFSKMTPAQRKDFTAKTEQLITATRDKAVSTIEAPSQANFDDLFGGGWVDDPSMGGLSVGGIAKEMARNEREIARPPAGWKNLWLEEALGIDKKPGARKKLVEGESKLGTMTRRAFTPKIQATLANLKGLTGGEGVAAYQEQQSLLARQKRVGELDVEMAAGGAAGVRAYQEQQGVKLSSTEQKRLEELNVPTNWMSGRSMMDQFVKLKGEGKGRQATQMLSALFKRGKLTKMSGALDKVLANEDFGKEDFNMAFSPTGTNLGGATDEESKVAYGIMQMVARGQESNTLPMFFQDITDQKPSPGLTPAQKNVLEFERAASIQSLYDPIEQAGAKARGFGFELQSNVAGRGRELKLGAAGRTRQAQQAAATGMFGNALFEETGRLKQQNMDAAIEAARLDISDTERLSVAGTKEKARATYLKTLQDKEIKTDARDIGTAQLGGWLEAMTLDEKKDARYKLRMSQNFNKTEVGAAQITYLTTVIDAEKKAREKAIAQGKEAEDVYAKNTAEVKASTEHLKKMKEAARHFYAGPHMDAIKDQRSKLREKIVWEEKQVKLGKLSAATLHESRMKLEDFNRVIDGTSRHLELLDERFQEILTGSFSKAELIDAAKAGKGKLNQQIRGRQMGGLGATAALGNAQEAYAANQITSSELRAIKANARLNAPGATGNPMEAFRDQFLYNGRDVMLDFESGVIGVADTMKSSFADAFRNIASGASSAQDAIAQFAGNILNAISDMSAQMATKMLFSRMGMSEGGQVPRYAGGGVVTGGSGMKDDVLSVMNGGEYVIKKSSAKKIGYDTLNAINSGGVGGFAEGGAQKGDGNMGKMFAISAAASAASGLISGQWGKSKKKPWRGQDYGQGRGEYGYFGGPDSDAGGRDSIAGGGRGAQVSLNKAYVYYRRDPKTGKLISERVRPTEGKYEVSGALSLLGRLNEEDRQTGRMFGKEQKMGAYSDYLFTETERRKEVIKAHKKQKRGRLIGAYMNAAMLIGGSYMMGKTGPMTSDLTGASVSSQGHRSFNALSASQRGGMSARDYLDAGVNINDSGYPDMATGGSAKGTSPAMLTGGEFVMGADTVRQYGLDFMGELNRGNVPGMAGGGPVSRGNQGAIAGMVSGGETNNNVNISINVDKRGNVEAKATQDPTESDNAAKENTVRDAENNKDLGKALQSVVLQELIRQQRPGGLLQRS